MADIVLGVKNPVFESRSGRCLKWFKPGLLSLCPENFSI